MALKSAPIDRSRIWGSKEFYEAALTLQLGNGTPESECRVTRINPASDLNSWLVENQSWNDLNQVPHGWNEFCEEQKNASSKVILADPWTVAAGTRRMGDHMMGMRESGGQTAKGARSSSSQAKFTPALVNLFA